MQYTLTDNGCLCLMLSEAELGHMGLCFDTLDRRDPKTRRLLRTLLLLARRRWGFAPDGPVAVEALPTADGCLFVVTPQTADTPQVFRVRDEDALLQLAAAWPPQKGGRSTLYRTADGFRLLLYGVPSCAALCECAEATDEEAAFVAEHGELWLAENALDRLRGSAPR